MKYGGFLYIMENRKAFQFYKSYYDVVTELENKDDKLNFLMALLQKQFEDVEPELTGLAKFAYISQKHSIHSQVEGYKNKVGVKPPKTTPSLPPPKGTTEPPTYVSNTINMTTEPPYLPPSVQEKEKEKEQVKEKEQLEIIMKKLNIK
jgi:hypothetical protein